MKEGMVDIYEEWFEAQMRNVHTCLPGKIESYTASSRKATVKVQIKFRTNKGTTLDPPPIDNIPVQFPGSKKFSFKYPLEKGDAGLLIFSEEGIGAYLKGKTVVDADSLARFAMTDAIFIPGVWPFVDVPTGELATIEIDTNGNVLIDGTGVQLNGSTKPFVTHAELDTALQTFKTALNLHTHPTAALGAPSPPTVPMVIDISASATTTVKTGG